MTDRHTANPPPAVGVHVLATVTSFGVLLAAWEISTRTLGIDSWILPSPRDVFGEFGASYASLAAHAWSTMSLAVSGFTIGILAGIAVAIALHNISVLKPAIYPLLVVSQNIPTIALAPLLIVWFGYGVTPKLIIIVLWSFFPVAVAAMDGFFAADRIKRNYLEMSGATRLQIFRMLEFPAGLPSIFSGIKLAASSSVICAVFIEWIGSDRGIGYYMLLQKNAYRVDRMFLSIALVVSLSLLLFAATVVVQKLVIRWRP